jgi:hypothetical protein
MAFCQAITKCRALIALFSMQALALAILIPALGGVLEKVLL